MVKESRLSITMKGVNTGVIRQNNNFIALALKIKEQKNQESLFFLPALALKDLLIALEYRLSQLSQLNTAERTRYEKARDKTIEKMHQNIPALQREELENADINLRVNTVTLTAHDDQIMAFEFGLQSGKTVALSIALEQMELLINAITHALNHAGMRELIVRISSILDFLPLYDVDCQAGGNLEYDSYNHPSWKHNLFSHHLAVLYRYQDKDGKTQFSGTVIKMRAKPGSKESEAITRRLLDCSPRLKKLAGIPSRVFASTLAVDKQHSLTADHCMKALYQLQQRAEKA